VTHTDAERHCPGRQHHGADHPPALRPDEYLCRECVARAMRDVEALAAELTEAEVTATRRARTYRGAGKMRDPDEDWRGATHALRPTQLPFDDWAAAVRADQVDLLRDWADFIRPLRKLDPLERRDSPRRLAEILDALKAGRNWMRTNEQGPLCADAIAIARHRLRAVIDRSEERWYAGRCGQPVTVVELDDVDGVITPVARESICTADLYAAPGKAAIVCDGYREPVGFNGCGAVHPALTRHKYVVRTLREKVLPLDAILSVLPSLIGRSPEPGTVRLWRHRGKLRPVVSLRRRADGGWRTGERYRGSDVIDLALDGRPGPKARASDAARAERAKVLQ
jgi:hypothetical protein